MSYDKFSTLEKIDNDTNYYIPFNNNFIRIEQIREYDQYSQKKAPFQGQVKVFLNLNTPCCVNKQDEYNVRIHKLQTENDTTPVFYLLPESFEEIFGPLFSLCKSLVNSTNSLHKNHAIAGARINTHKYTKGLSGSIFRSRVRLI